MKTEELIWQQAQQIKKNGMSRVWEGREEVMNCSGRMFQQLVAQVYGGPMVAWVYDGGW